MSTQHIIAIIFLPASYLLPETSASALNLQGEILNRSLSFPCAAPPPTVVAIISLRR
jgi:hypothetical protein